MRTTIGVSGHRNLPDDSEGLVRAIDQTLVEIERSFPSQSYSILSSLAEGADRQIVARAFELLSARLIVPLPMTVMEYARDFKAESSRQEFAQFLARADQVIELLPLPSRDAGYLSAGLYVLDHCGVLITIWDGLPARGTGGTGQIVAQARLIGKPVAWIKIDQAPGNDPRFEIIYERFPGSGSREGDDEKISG